MGASPFPLLINPTTGWVESFGFFLGSVGDPDEQVGSCAAEAYLTDGDAETPVSTSVSSNMVTLAMPRGTEINDGPYTLVVRVIDPALPADRYAFEISANVESL